MEQLLFVSSLVPHKQIPFENFTLSKLTMKYFILVGFIFYLKNFVSNSN
jgi:hypothetical protein